MSFLPLLLWAGPPSILDLQPRGAQKGRPFKLVVTGKDLSGGARIDSTLPATFTSLALERGQMDGQAAVFLVEPKGDVPVGVYPIRVVTPDGISNVHLLTIGAFPELTEEESEPGSLPNRNDTIETAQPLPTANVTVNGKLRGAERDLYRVQAKAGEKKVFEVEARRSGSAIDPVIRVTDSQGKLLARSEDAALAGLDARLEVTFPAAGYYYVEVHDARFSTQAANFYRLKSGQFTYPTEIFPLGGRRGTKTPVMISGTQVVADFSGRTAQVNLPDAVTLPVTLAISDEPELDESAGRLSIPSVMNGRLSKPAEIDRYLLAVTPGQVLLFDMQARELGTSRIAGVITVRDTKGKKLASAGDTSILLGVNSVQFESRTAGDPYLRFVVPEGTTEIAVSVEDLAERGGPGFAYRLRTRISPHEFSVLVNTPQVNIPAGGSVAVPLIVERRGYNGPLQIMATKLPKGIRAEGGWVPEELIDPATGLTRTGSRKGVLVLSAEAEATLPMTELQLVAEATLPDGQKLSRPTRGLGLLVNVNGATAQGVVDRQRGITSPGLFEALPAATTTAPPATLEVTLAEQRMKAEGEEFVFRYQWRSRRTDLEWPGNLTAEMVNAADTRTIDFKPNPKDRSTGTFTITTTKNTMPTKYDVYVFGRLMGEEIPARPIQVQVKEVPASEVSTGQ
ncbi:MAG: hypothetical protein K2X03_02910 [Bryobacteraceae bacterium]|nr:hypothetical protein [Bryobacteraceae bacterium]